MLNTKEPGEWDFRGADTGGVQFSLLPHLSSNDDSAGRSWTHRALWEEGRLALRPVLWHRNQPRGGKAGRYGRCRNHLNPTARLIALAKTNDYDIKALRDEVGSFLEGLEERLQSIENYNGFPEPEFVTFDRLEDWFPVKSIGEIYVCVTRSRRLRTRRPNFSSESRSRSA